jgi:hypothetical protein
MNRNKTWTLQASVRYDADVGVIGGGIAGFCAAIAAADMAVSVVLVERFAVTGGVLTTGGVANFSGDTRGLGRVMDEILSKLTEFQAIGPLRDSVHNTKEQIFDHEILAIILQQMLVQHGVKTLLHTRFVDTEADETGTIRECLVCGQSGPELLRAKVFVDCTGEGQVAHRAGFTTMKGREEDGLQLPMSLMFFIREMSETVKPQVPQGWFSSISEKDELPMTSTWPNGPQGKAIKLKIPGFDSTDTESMSKGEIRARQRMMEVLDYYQRVEKKCWRYDHCSPIIGIREGRRIVGDYILTVEDVRAGRAFPDGVARGTWYLDGHKPDDEKRTYILGRDELAVPPYQIPLRCLIARDGKNLMMAGRCFSADQLTLSSARVSTSGAMMGQAAGISAALAVKRNCQVREIDVGDIIAVVKEKGGYLYV